MKKFASILLAGLMALSLFAGCSSEVTSTDDGSSAAHRHLSHHYLAALPFCFHKSNPSLQS